MPDQTPNLALPWLMPAQAQKHVTVNEALGRLDALVQTSVESRSVSAEPASPTEGQAWLIPAAASGASWAGFDEHDLAYFQDGAWHAVSARTGQLAYIRDENALFVFDGNSWVGLSSLVTALGNLELLGVGTTADASNPFTARLNNALWTARPAGEGGTGDIRLVMNKETGADTASFIFQSGWSGRAEFGLTGADDFSIKLSADGASWADGMVLERDTGQALFPNGLKVGQSGNLLDVFEQGSWTPEVADALTGGNVVTTSARDGRYLRIGNMVHLWITIDGINVASLTSTNTLYVRNLPFACGPEKAQRGIFIPQTKFMKNGDALTGLNLKDESAIVFALQYNAANLSLALVSDITSTGTAIQGQVTYLTGD